MFGLGGQRRCLGQQGGLDLRATGQWGEQLIAEEGCEAQGAKTHAGPLQELAPRQEVILKMDGMLVLIHSVILIHLTYPAN
jgi:hypothetical protein